MAALFTDEARLGLWLEVELLALEALAKLGVVPADPLRVRERAPVVDARLRRPRRRARGGHRPRRRRLRRRRPGVDRPPGGRGSTTASPRATSSTPRSRSTLVARRRPAHRRRRRARRGAEARALEHAAHADARAHPRHARRADDLRRQARALLPAGRPRPRRACAGPATPIAVGKLSGAVGTYSNIDPAIEAHVCAALGLRPVPATQVLARDRHAEYLYACASVGATIEAIATELRHLQRSEVARGRGAVRRRAEGLLGDAAQAQPDHRRAARRHGAGAARLSRRRPRGRRAVARARHLAQLGRAHRPPRREPRSPTTACAG